MKGGIQTVHNFVTLTSVLSTSEEHIVVNVMHKHFEDKQKAQHLFGIIMLKSIKLHPQKYAD